MAGPLAVLGQGLQGLGDEGHVVFVDVEAQQPQSPSGAATHDVEELQCLTHQVVVGFVVLAPEEVLSSKEWSYGAEQHHSDGGDSPDPPPNNPSSCSLMEDWAGSTSVTYKIGQEEMHNSAVTA